MSTPKAVNHQARTSPLNLRGRKPDFLYYSGLLQPRQVGLQEWDWRLPDPNPVPPAGQQRFRLLLYATIVARPDAVKPAADSDGLPYADGGRPRPMLVLNRALADNIATTYTMKDPNSKTIAKSEDAIFSLGVISWLTTAATHQCEELAAALILQEEDLAAASATTGPSAAPSHTDMPAPPHNPLLCNSKPRSYGPSTYYCSLPLPERAEQLRFLSMRCDPGGEVEIALHQRDSSKACEQPSPTKLLNIAYIDFLVPVSDPCLGWFQKHPALNPLRVDPSTHHAQPTPNDWKCYFPDESGKKGKADVSELRTLLPPLWSLQPLDHGRDDGGGGDDDSASVSILRLALPPPPVQGRTAVYCTTNWDLTFGGWEEESGILRSDGGSWANSAITGLNAVWQEHREAMTSYDLGAAIDTHLALQDTRLLDIIMGDCLYRFAGIPLPGFRRGMNVDPERHYRAAPTVTVEGANVEDCAKKGGDTSSEGRSSAGHGEKQRHYATTTSAGRSACEKHDQVSSFSTLVASSSDGSEATKEGRSSVDPTRQQRGHRGEKTSAMQKLRRAFCL